MRTTPAIPRSGAAGGSLAATSMGARVRAFFKRLGLALAVYRERRALMALSDHQLKDIGLSRSQVEREISRGFFDLPNQSPLDRRLRGE
jgi:hypothetical protein